MTRSFKMPALLVSALCISTASISQFGNGQSQFAPPPPAIAQTFAGSEPSVSFANWAMRQDQNQNSWVRIGGYKVKGTPYLFGMFFKANVFTPDAKGENVNIAFDTYNQQLEILNPGESKAFVKTASDIDSFVLKADTSRMVMEDMFFVNAKQLDPSLQNLFLHQLYGGKKFKLYKSYKSELAVVSENYVQSDLRQFDLGVNYYYYDVQNKRLKKLKVSARNIENEFSKTAPGLLVNGDALKANPQATLMSVFVQLN